MIQQPATHQILQFFFWFKKIQLFPFADITEATVAKMKFNTFMTFNGTKNGISTHLPACTGRVCPPLFPKSRSTKLDSCPSKGMMQFRWCEDTAKVSKLAKQSRLTGRAASCTRNGCFRKRLMTQHPCGGRPASGHHWRRTSKHSLNRKPKLLSRKGKGHAYGRTTEKMQEQGPQTHSYHQKSLM